MADTSRMEELRRRVQRDPASIAFAQLAEEYRRAGRFQEAIETCEAGLAHHPGYLSARVTLGRALLEQGELAAAQLELKQVLRAAPENLAALRGLAEIHHRRGELQEALAHYRTALEFARQDPELEHAIEEIQRELEPRPAAPPVVDGLSFEEVKDAFLTLSESGPVPIAQIDVAPAPDAPDPAESAGAAPLEEPIPTLDPAPIVLEAGLPGDAALPVEPVADPVAALEPTFVVVPVASEEPSAAAEPVSVPEPAVAGLSVVLEPDDFADALRLVGPSVLPVAPVPPVAPDPVESPSPSPETAAATDSSPASPAGELVIAPADEPLMLSQTAGPELAAPAADVELHPKTRPQVDALERWLEAILADRERRQE